MDWNLFREGRYLNVVRGELAVDLGLGELEVRFLDF